VRSLKNFVIDESLRELLKALRTCTETKVDLITNLLQSSVLLKKSLRDVGAFLGRRRGLTGRMFGRLAPSLCLEGVIASGLCKPKNDMPHDYGHRLRAFVTKPGRPLKEVNGCGIDQSMVHTCTEY
jgi:hypothetical protein